MPGYEDPGAEEAKQIFLKEAMKKMSIPQREIPKYKCHKEVHALKIAAIEYDHTKAQAENRETDGSAMIVPAGGGYAPFRVDFAYLNKHKPEVGGYYVVYEDGYKSFSPAKAFEDGYAKI
jgi:hypothetical protein